MTTPSPELLEKARKAVAEEIDCFNQFESESCADPCPCKLAAERVLALGMAAGAEAAATILDEDGGMNATYYADLIRARSLPKKGRTP